MIVKDLYITDFVVYISGILASMYVAEAFPVMRENG